MCEMLCLLLQHHHFPPFFAFDKLHIAHHYAMVMHDILNKTKRCIMGSLIFDCEHPMQKKRNILPLDNNNIRRLVQ